MLQSQAFEINSELLEFIHNNEILLVQSGLLMPRFLASVNIPEALKLLSLGALEQKFRIATDTLINQVCSTHPQAEQSGF